VQTPYSAKDIAPRLVTGFLTANLSLILISQATTIANALSAALAGSGVTPSTAASALLGTLTAPLSGGGIFLVLLALAGAVLQRQAQRPKPDWADQALLARPPGTSPSAQ
jgi:hypothetical protein